MWYVSDVDVKLKITNDDNGNHNRFMINKPISKNCIRIFQLRRALYSTYQIYASP